MYLDYTSIVAGGIAIVAIFLMRRRLARARPLRIRRQWVALSIIAAVTTPVFFLASPGSWVLVWSAIALLCGAWLGALRARRIRVFVGEGGQVFQQVTPAAFRSLLFILLLLILVIRPIVRSALAYELGDAARYSDLGTLAFGFGLIAGGRIDLTYRSRKLWRPAER